MTLRRKTILITTITLIGLILLLYLTLRVLILQSYIGLEQQTMLRNLNRAGNSLQDAIERLQWAISDWAAWDDTYAFVQGDSAEYIEANLMDDTFWALKVNLMMFVNAASEVVYAKMVDVDDAEQTRLLAAFEETARDDKRFLNLTTGTPIAGFMVVGGEPMIVVSHPIMRSDESGPQAGTLIWARHLNQQELAAISTSLRLSIALFDTAYSDLPTDVTLAQQSLSSASPQIVNIMDDNTVGGYALLTDIYDNPALILRASQGREIYWQGQAALTYFLIALVVIGIVFGVGTLLLVDWLVLRRLTRLNDHVRQIGINDDFSMRLLVEGRDELAQLGIAINAVLGAVAHSRAALQELNVELEQRVAARTTQLEHQKSQLQTIMDAMGEGLVYCVDGRIQYVNDAFIDMLDYPVRDLVGMSFGALTTHPHQMGPARRYETALVRQDGTTVSVAVTSMPVDVFDDHERCVIIVRDITQELKAKAQKEYFYARASHDLRSPLTSIMTRLYLLEKKPEQLETHLKILNRTSDRMLQLVNDLLDVSRANQNALVLKRRDLVLQTIIDEVVEIQQADAEQRNTCLMLEQDETPLHVNVDPLRINQVITNLVSNAIQYTPEGGTIIVRLETGEDNGTKHAIVRVSDSGIGISRENIDHIFEPFFRVDGNQENGSGLGLYIVNEIVQLHAGKISVESEVGKGTTFSVYLALNDACPDDTDDTAKASSASSTHSPENVADKSPVQ
ncbi:MAG: PAS domain-containing protein [Anaerolineae bacterium]|nr:PAS domain-containing protein [Anaerolineae bacterium]